MIEGAASRRQRTPAGGINAAGPVTEEVEVKENVQIIVVLDMTESAGSPELASRVIKGKRKMREAMHSICSPHDVDFRKPVEEQKLMHARSLLGSVDLVLSDPPCTVRSCSEEANSHYNVFISEFIEDSVALR